MSLENIAQFLDNVKERKLALEVLEVFGKNAQSFDQFDDVSRVFFKVKDYDASIKYGEKAYAIASSPEQMYVIRNNLINVYNHNNQPEKALRYIRANEAVKEIDIDRDFEKAYAYFLSNRKPEAATLLREKLNDPSLSEEQRVKTEFNMGTYNLLEGNFQQGLKQFLLSGEEMGLWGYETFMSQEKDHYGLKKWNGVIKPGLKLVCIADAGIGDEVINVRFFNSLKEYGIDAVWLTLKSRAGLVEIFAENGITSYSDIKSLDKDFLKDACYVSSMQLPIYLNCEYKDLFNGNYLTKLPEAVDTKWKERLGSGKLKIGLRYRGQTAYDNDLHRSIPFAEMYAAVKLSLPDAEIYSIQRDEGLEELIPFPDVIDLSSELATLGDFFGAINNLDIIISSCTSAGHIAAAMGKKIFILPPISSYYVWTNPTVQSPWYGDNLTLIPQEKPRSWKEPLAKLSNLLKDS